MHFFLTEVILSFPEYSFNEHMFYYMDFTFLPNTFFCGLKAENLEVKTNDRKVIEIPCILLGRKKITLKAVFLTLPVLRTLFIFYILCCNILAAFSSPRLTSIFISTFTSFKFCSQDPLHLRTVLS